VRGDLSIREKKRRFYAISGPVHWLNRKRFIPGGSHDNRDDETAE